LIAPRLFRSEVTAVVRKAVFQQRINPEQGHVILSQLLIYPVEFHEDIDLLKAAYELAVRFNRPELMIHSTWHWRNGLIANFGQQMRTSLTVFKRNFAGSAGLASWT
jgi:hypothetical protein